MPGEEMAAEENTNIIEILTALNNAGVEFAIGGPSHLITPEQAVQFLADPDAVYAELHGIPREAWLEFDECEGYIQCSAQTKSNRRCKNIIARHWHADEWYEAEKCGGYCWIHSEGFEP